jgi:SAM-dependent methyltransferase
MSLSPQEWHARYSLQAGWTRSLRRFLLPRAGLEHASRVLDVGCGTGALHGELHQNALIQVHGLDLDPGMLAAAARISPSSIFALGDAHALPYTDSSFDIALCHYLLLWVADPSQVLSEMRRVTRPGGALLALAEPDYGGRIDYPPELAELGRMQVASLRQQGAEPELGRRLAGLFTNLGLEGVEVGVLGAQWSGPLSLAELESEWTVIRSDLGDSLSLVQLERLRQLEAEAWQSGARVLYVPTFYAWGRAPL